MTQVSIKVRKRERYGRPREGLEHAWTEWQVVSGRTVVSRHDFEEQANIAADQLRRDWDTRTQRLQNTE